jgi:hypothetical protein
MALRSKWCLRAVVSGAVRRARGAEPRVDGVESFHFTRPVDDHRDAERPLQGKGRISRMEPQRLVSCPHELGRAAET